MNASEGTVPFASSFRLPTATVILGTVTLAVVAWQAADVGVMFFVTFAVVFCLHVAAVVEAIAASALKRRMQFSLRRLLFLIAWIALYVSMLRDPWPFRLRFAFSQGALERLAARVERGELLAEPEWAGLFYIRKIGHKERGGETYTVLWTEPEGGSPTGFIHHPPQDRGRFNDWSAGLQHNDDWQFFIED
jgi:hypothetical protein